VTIEGAYVCSMNEALALTDFLLFGARYEYFTYLCKTKNCVHSSTTKCTC